MEQGRKESNRKGIANHPDPESCECSRKAAGEALTGAAKSILSGAPTLFGEAEGHIRSDEQSEPLMNPAQSETPNMLGNSMRENRETPRASGSRRPDRLEKVTSYKISVNAGGESDEQVVCAEQRVIQEGLIPLAL